MTKLARNTLFASLDFLIIIEARASNSNGVYITQAQSPPYRSLCVNNYFGQSLKKDISTEDSKGYA